MKTSAIFFFILIIALLSGCIKDSTKNKLVTIDNQNYTLKIAQTEGERRLGLSFTNSLEKNSGMLFIFDKKDKYSFWMKDTLVPLQIIFINDCKIIDIQEMKVEGDPQNPQKIYTPSEAIDKAIELRSGSVSKDVLGSQIDQLCQ